MGSPSHPAAEEGAGGLRCYMVVLDGLQPPYVYT